MTTVQVSRRDLPDKIGMISQKRRARAHRTKISQVYPDVTEDQLSESHNAASKLDPLDQTVLSLEMLNQYNSVIGKEDSLAYKRLPPVKLSYQPTKKFMESPRGAGDYSSRILRPHLTLKTYSPGHHIFTEGISRNSEISSPTFALQKVGVPYSNLPDNVAVYKDKDKFAFSIKREEYDKSPYRLTPKPMLIGGAHLLNGYNNKIVIPSADQDTVESEESPKEMTTKISSRSSVSLKSNVLKLEPITGREKTDTNFNERDPLLPTGILIPTEKKSLNSSKTKDTKTGSERKLSIISVGEDVAPDFFRKHHREVRLQYPMYDHVSRKYDKFRKEKFRNTDRFHAKPHVPKSTFTYKVSTRGHTFIQDSSPDKFRPIRNNLRDRHGNPINWQRNMSKYTDDSETNGKDKRQSDYNFRRYYSRSFHAPNSAGSSSTDMTHMPGNPPPSEISHIISEDGAPILINDGRNGMLTLHEERTLTASMMSQRNDGAEPEKRHVNSACDSYVAQDEKATARTNITFTTDTEVQFQMAEKIAEKAKQNKQSVAKSTEENSNKNEDSSKSNAEIVEESEKENITNENKNDEKTPEANVENTESNRKNKNADEVKAPLLEPIPTDYKPQLTNSNGNNKSIASGSKPLLTVPKLSLDNTSLPLIVERTSLSRKIQNMPVSENSKTVSVSSADNLIEKDKDKTQVNEMLVPVPITCMRLFSETSTSSVTAPSVSVTDENGEEQELVTIQEDPDYMEPPEPIIHDTLPPIEKEKKLLNNSNVKFIYPAMNETKAKRQ